MPRPPSLSRFVTTIISAQTKSGLAFVNIRIPFVSGNKRTRNEKNDDQCNALVGHCDSTEYEAQGKEYGTMESKETTHVLCGKSIYEAVRFSGSKETQENTESINEDFRYHAIDPICMNVRLCVFWFLWAMLIVVFIISILSYCCFMSKMCRNFDKIVTSNITNA